MSDQKNASLGFWASLIRQIRLAWGLMRDPRVPAWLKFVPVLTVIYIISPFDFIPDFMLGVGQVDDVGAFGALLLGIKLLVNMSPAEVVKHHLAYMGYTDDWQEQDLDESAIDGDYEIIDD